LLSYIKTPFTNVTVKVLSVKREIIYQSAIFNYANLHGIKISYNNPHTMFLSTIVVALMLFLT